jgi:orotidine-5'-phosphate decarboxylase
MGEDSITPFLNYKNKWVILLALTSNQGSKDFQMSSENARNGASLLYEEVIQKSQHWGSADNMMYVIGATHPEMFSHVRSLAPDHFFLVPGVGAQGGDLKEIAHYGMNNQCGLIVNASRSIIYASTDNNFAEAAREEATKLQTEMLSLLMNKFR